jgi:hypothetical protein
MRGNLLNNSQNYLNPPLYFRDICRNFGDFQLATFSDEEYPNGIAGKLEGK